MQELKSNNRLAQNGAGGWGARTAGRESAINLASPKLNKKAMAESITTFALIIIAIVAVGFAGYSLMKLFTLGDIQSSPTYSCLDLTSRLSNPLELTKACLNPEGDIEATVKRTNEDFLIASLTFTLQDESWTCKEGCDCSILEPGTSKTYYLTPDQDPLGKTLKFYVGTCEINERKVISC
ncbi:MAG: hypothetical protein ABH864_00055 [archaeon]